jgi:diaminohydroxyphosphoribosylaminopyrimidine deaminase / 5-amino-6-(5-phosphoribosylamino)uracil reductase
MRDIRFLEYAKKISEKSNHHSFKLGCVITKGSRIIGTGCNIIGKTHSESPHKFHTIHAEFNAILNAKNKHNDIYGATAYVFRAWKNGTWAIARPCPTCRNFLIKNGIKEIVYSFQGYFRKENL